MKIKKSKTKTTSNSNQLKGIEDKSSADRRRANAIMPYCTVVERYHTYEQCFYPIYKTVINFQHEDFDACLQVALKSVPDNAFHKQALQAEVEYYKTTETKQLQNQERVEADYKRNIALGLTYRECK